MNLLLKKIKLPALLLAILILPVFFGHHVSVEIKSLSYAISVSMKSILEFVLPFIIFSFVFSCLINLQKGAIFFVLLLIACVFCSNFTALMIGFTSGKYCLGWMQMHQAVVEGAQVLMPAWSFHLKKLVSNDTALLTGFISGIFFSLFPHPAAKRVGDKLNALANRFLKNLFIPLLPIFILGFVFKLEYENILHRSLAVYGPVLLIVIMTQWLYLSFWYFVASRFSLKRFLVYIKNVLPATLTGLSTISSAASMPVLMISTEKNLNDPDKAKMLIPAIINIHTIGSAIAIPILSLATLKSFGLPIPSLSVFLVFAFYAALAKYAVAAVPGGVIIVMAPLLETWLGFTPEMVGLITAVYLICDPFGTSANVTGNGAFPILFTRLHSYLSRTADAGIVTEPIN